MSDTKEKLFCPACGEEMKKIFLEAHNINVDICINGCGGIFFDNRELEKFDESHKNADIILKELDNKYFKQVDTDLQRVCPVCGTKMMKFGAANGDIEIDVCAVCGGKFLDAGELQTIRKTPKEELSNELKTTLATLYNENLNQITYNFGKVFDENKLNKFVEVVAKTFGAE